MTTNVDQREQAVLEDTNMNNLVVSWGTLIASGSTCMQIAPGLIIRCAYFSINPIRQVKNGLVYRFEGENLRDFAKTLEEKLNEFAVEYIPAGDKLKRNFKDLSNYAIENNKSLYVTVPFTYNTYYAIEEASSIGPADMVLLSKTIYGTISHCNTTSSDFLKVLDKLILLPPTYKILIGGEEITNRCNHCEHQLKPGDSYCINYTSDYMCFFNAQLNPTEISKVTKDLYTAFLTGTKIDKSDVDLLTKFNNYRDFEEWYKENYPEYYDKTQADEEVKINEQTNS